VWWLPHALPLLLAGAALAGGVAWARVRSGRAVALVVAAWLSHWPGRLAHRAQADLPGRAVGWGCAGSSSPLAATRRGGRAARRRLAALAAHAPRAAPPRARVVASLALAALLVLQLTVDLVFASAHR
jgi:hypothetical protein